MAGLPLPGLELTTGEQPPRDRLHIRARPAAAVAADVAPAAAVAADANAVPAAAVPADLVPAGVRSIARTLRAAGHEAHLVGGCVRDLLRGIEPLDWDVATDARPDRLLALLPGARYENRFGTVAVPLPDGTHEVTTFRRDGTYSDHRRPDDVTFGDTLDEDLARRDFTVNAMAIPLDGDGTPGAVVDRFDGRADLAAGVLRAVGDPGARFREDALRMLRAVRFAATLGFTVEPETRAAIAAEASLALHVSGERTFVELMRLLAADRPSIGLRLAEEAGLLGVVAPELALQRGIPQAKIPGDDLWDHTWRTADAAARTLLEGLPLARTAALLHDIGKPATFADGHFVGHDTVGAELAAEWLDGLRAPRAFTARVASLVRHHMFAYAPEWTDAAIRRFIRRVGLADLDELLDLRAADNVGSGLPSNVDGLDELRERCRAQVANHVALERGDLAVDGDDLMRALGLAAGPAVGRLLDALLERVLADPMLNERGRLLAIARDIAEKDATDVGDADDAVGNDADDAVGDADGGDAARPGPRQPPDPPREARR
jgi:tRNA nucleotidyltransferase (CCA-adding enzyme)